MTTVSVPEPPRLSGSTLPDFARRAREMRITISPQQMEISNRLVAPRTGELLEAARICRRIADGELRAAMAAGETLPGGKGLDPSIYPIDFCFAICNRVFELLSEMPPVPELCAQGVLWKKIYFIQDSCFFQNAIQCGDYLLDVAYDTYTPALPPVSCNRLNEVKWEPLNDYRQTGLVAEQYYRLRLFPNLYFPELFPVAPFLALHENGQLNLFWHEHLLFFMDFDENFPRLRALLDDPKWMGRELPEPHAAHFKNRLTNRFDLPSPVFMRTCTPIELGNLLDEWNTLRTLPSEPFDAMLIRLDQRLQATAAWLATAV